MGEGKEREAVLREGATTDGKEGKGKARAAGEGRTTRNERLPRRAGAGDYGRGCVCGVETDKNDRTMRMESELG